jgi:hypothetical protein
MDVKSSAKASFKLRTQCEKLKKILSANPEVRPEAKGRALHPLRSHCAGCAPLTGAGRSLLLCCPAQGLMLDFPLPVISAAHGSSSARLGTPPHCRAGAGWQRSPAPDAARAAALQAPLNIECLLDDKDVRSTMSRDKLEQLVGPLFPRVQQAMERVSSSCGAYARAWAWAPGCLLGWSRGRGMGVGRPRA